MSIPPRFVSDLRDRLTLSNVVGRKVRLARSGREFKGCCPFHKEKTPSFYVNDEKGFFHCFGCGAHGDAVGFMMRHDNLSFVESVELLATEAGMEVPKQTPEEIQKSKLEKSLFTLLEDTTKFFEDALYQSQNKDVLNYLLKRGLSPETIASFRIGFAPQDDQALRKHLKLLQYSDDQMIEAGVLKASSKGLEPYAFFRDRVMFPVMDIRGRTIAFGGRVLPDHMRPPHKDPNYKPPKYINSSDTTLFHKGRNLYAQQHARQHANDRDIVVVEGYMDVIALHQVGVNTAVAPLGTALTEDQMAHLWRMTPHDVKMPILCFDGDNAGYRAALRAAERALPMLKPNQSLRFCFLPEGEDPDTYVTGRGINAFEDLLKRAVSLSEFLWTHYTAGKNFTSPELRAGLSQTLDDIASRVQDGGVQYHLRQDFRDRVRGMFRAAPQNSYASKPSFAKGMRDKIMGVKIPLPAPRRQQDMIPQILLAILMNHPWLYPEVEGQFFELYPENYELRQIHDQILAFFSENNAQDLDKDAIFAHLEHQGLADIAKNLTSLNVTLHAGCARPDATPDKVREGWIGFWTEWERSKLSHDVAEARRVLKSAMTHENEQKLVELSAQNDRRTYLDEI
jgi:DNA primase